MTALIRPQLQDRILATLDWTVRLGDHHRLHIGHVTQTAVQILMNTNKVLSIKTNTAKIPTKGLFVKDYFFLIYFTIQFIFIIIHEFYYTF